MNTSCSYRTTIIPMWGPLRNLHELSNWAGYQESLGGIDGSARMRTSFLPAATTTASTRATSTEAIAIE